MPWWYCQMQYILMQMWRPGVPAVPVPYHQFHPWWYLQSDPYNASGWSIWLRMHVCHWGLHQPLWSCTKGWWHCHLLTFGSNAICLCRHQLTPRPLIRPSQRLPDWARAIWTGWSIWWSSMIWGWTRKPANSSKVFWPSPHQLPKPTRTTCGGWQIMEVTQTMGTSKPCMATVAGLKRCIAWSPAHSASMMPCSTMCFHFVLHVQQCPCSTKCFHAMSMSQHIVLPWCHVAPCVFILFYMFNHVHVAPSAFMPCPCPST